MIHSSHVFFYFKIGFVRHLVHHHCGKILTASYAVGYFRTASHENRFLQKYIMWLTRFPQALEVLEDLRICKKNFKPLEVFFFQININIRRLFKVLEFVYILKIIMVIWPMHTVHTRHFCNIEALCFW